MPVSMWELRSWALVLQHSMSGPVGLLLLAAELAVLGVRVLLYSAAHQLGGFIQTWLILPVVICLSQRLSHACLSISFYTAKLRMAH